MPSMLGGFDLGFGADSLGRSVQSLRSTDRSPLGIPCTFLRSNPGGDSSRGIRRLGRSRDICGSLDDFAAYRCHRVYQGQVLPIGSKKAEIRGEGAFEPGPARVTVCIRGEQRSFKYLASGSACYPALVGHRYTLPRVPAPFGLVDECHREIGA